MALLWSGRGITGESLRDLKTDIEHIDIAVFILVSCMVADPRGRDSSMSSVSTESQYGACDISMVCQSGMEIF